MNGKDYRGLKNEGMGLGMIKGWVGKIRGGLRHESEGLERI